MAHSDTAFLKSFKAVRKSSLSDCTASFIISDLDRDSSDVMSGKACSGVVIGMRHLDWMYSLVNCCCLVLDGFDGVFCVMKFWRKDGCVCWALSSDGDGGGGGGGGETDEVVVVVAAMINDSAITLAFCPILSSSQPIATSTHHTYSQQVNSGPRCHYPLGSTPPNVLLTSPVEWCRYEKTCC